MSGPPDSQEDSRRVETRVKVCGLTRRGDVRTAARAGVTFAGLVFADSPRRVSPEAAADLVRGLDVRPVGVFVDAGRDEILRVAREVPLDVVQLHGGETAEECEALGRAGLRVWKALRPRSREELGAGLRTYLSAVDAILVEGYSPEATGGVGASVPLEWVVSLRREVGWAVGADGGAATRLVLAGGLTPANVAGAVASVRPDVVDVSSGVERRAGEKSPELVRAFVSAVREGGALGATADADSSTAPAGPTRLEEDATGGA